MADKATQLILDALTRAATEPAGLPLHARKADPGLFPSTVLAKTAADRAKTEGLLEIVEAGQREIARLTDKGMQFLVSRASPRDVLRDFVRLLEERQAAVTEFARSANEMAASLSSMRAIAEAVLPRIENHTATNGKMMNGVLTTPRSSSIPTTDHLIADIKARLSEWHAAADASQDCPLSDLYRRLESETTVGLFHDALRQLHEDSQVYLHPWTGPLYALPEPAFALMVGHEVAYYASIR